MEEKKQDGIDYLYFAHIVVPMGISHKGYADRFPPKKTSCNRVALRNPN